MEKLYRLLQVLSRAGKNGLALTALLAEAHLDHNQETIKMAEGLCALGLATGYYCSDERSDASVTITDGGRELYEAIRMKMLADGQD